MENIELTPEHIQELTDLMNKAISVLTPEAKPGTLIELSQDQLRRIAEVLGTKATGRQVEAFVHHLQEKWKNNKNRSDLLAKLLAVVVHEIELFEFYDPSQGTDRPIPYPSHVRVLNADRGTSDKQIPIEEFLAQLEAIHDSSVFKK